MKQELIHRTMCLTEERLGFINPAETRPKFSGLSRKASRTQEVFEQIE